MKKRKIVILATGGTIAGKELGRFAQDGYKPGEMRIGELVEGLSELNKTVDVQTLQISNIASDDITFRHWALLAETINRLSEDPDVDGFVITHGTNTIEETAYFLNLTVKTNKPLVMVGSMRPFDALSADGPLNLYQAVALAASPQAGGRGVMLVFCESIYAARDMTKQSTYSPDAFGCNHMSALGYIKGTSPHFNYEITKAHTMASEFDVETVAFLPRVDILYMYAECALDLLQHSLSAARGLVIAGAGNGCYTELWQEKIEEYAYRNVPVVRCSRINGGIVTEEPYYDKAQNVIIGNNLSPQKARILLQLALSKTSDLNEIKRMFRMY